MMGLAQGADTEAGEISSGSDMGSFNGYKLTFVSREVSPSNFIDVTTEAALKTAFADSTGQDAIIKAD